MAGLFYIFLNIAAEILSRSSTRLSKQRSIMSAMSPYKTVRRDGLLALPLTSQSSGAGSDKKLRTTMAAVAMGALAKYHLDMSSAGKRQSSVSAPIMRRYAYVIGDCSHIVHKSEFVQFS